MLYRKRCHCRVVSIVIPDDDALRLNTYNSTAAAAAAAIGNICCITVYYIEHQEKSRFPMQEKNGWQVGIFCKIDGELL